MFRWGCLLVYVVALALLLALLVASLLAIGGSP